MTPVMTRPYKVTDELFDLSTMAMEYFKEHIEPTLPEINYFSSNFLDFHSSFGCEFLSNYWISLKYMSVIQLQQCGIKLKFLLLTLLYCSPCICGNFLS